MGVVYYIIFINYFSKNKKYHLPPASRGTPPERRRNSCSWYVFAVKSTKLFFPFRKEYYLCTRYVERFEIDCNHRKKNAKAIAFFSPISIRYIPQPVN